MSVSLSYLSIVRTESCGLPAETPPMIARSANDVNFILMMRCLLKFCFPKKYKDEDVNFMIFEIVKVCVLCWYEIGSTTARCQPFY